LVWQLSLLPKVNLAHKINGASRNHLVSGYTNPFGGFFDKIGTLVAACQDPTSVDPARLEVSYKTALGQ
jgi:hypothetical protein